MKKIINMNTCICVAHRGYGSAKALSSYPADEFSAVPAQASLIQ